MSVLEDQIHTTDVCLQRLVYKECAKIKKEYAQSIGQILGKPTSTNPLQETRDELVNLVKSKASTEELTRVIGDKTNKFDTAKQTEQIETMQRILGHLATLLVE